jgi:hypothetical protein
MDQTSKLGTDNDTSLFADEDELEYLFGTLFQLAQREYRVAEQICAKGLIIQWQYENPRHALTVNAAKQPAHPGTYFDVIWGFEQASHLQPHIILKMSATTAHYYFLNKVNAILAIARKEIIFSPVGSIKQILELEPSIKPLCTMYPDVLRRVGRDDLLSTRETRSK